jgi:hypothetical protein
MRTVHETEALRPSDPVPKHHSSNPQNKSQRLRLTFNKFSSGANGKAEDDGSSPVSIKAKDGPLSPTIPIPVPADAEYELNNTSFARDSQTGDWVARFPTDVTFSENELALPSKQLLILLHKQVHWATEHSEELRKQENGLAEQHKAEWISKEALLRDFLGREMTIAEQELLEEAREAAEEDMDEPMPSQEDVQQGEVPPYAAPEDQDESMVNGGD